jgi:hypothetical protein
MAKVGNASAIPGGEAGERPCLLLLTGIPGRPAFCIYYACHISKPRLQWSLSVPR